MLILFCIIVNGLSFNLPGIQQKSYVEGESLSIVVNEMTSETTQIPYDYYDLEICKPINTENQNQNIGSIILGTLTQQSSYNIYMNYNQSNEIICQKNFSKTEINNLKWFIDHDYRVNMQIDGLPLLSEDSNKNKIIGVPLGFKSGHSYLFYNHYDFIIEVFTKDELNFLINNVIVAPHSICYDTDQIQTGIPCFLDQLLNISYNVEYKYSNQSNRWQAYLEIANESEQWISIGLTFIISLLLTTLIALVIRFVIKRDVLKFEMLPNEESDALDQMGWKQISRDVFRPPNNPLILSIAIGTGIQLTIMILAILFFSSFGVLYQAHTGHLATVVIVVYVFTGSLNGYYSSKYYKYLKGEYWLLCTLTSNSAFPIMALFIFGIENIVLFFEESSSGLDFKSGITFIALQLGIQTPLNLIGSFLGFKTEIIKNPCKYGTIAQPIPQQPFYLDYFYSCLIGGLICFISIGLEINQIMQLIWKNSYYEFFVTLFFSSILLIIICAEVSIISTYLLLLNQNHRWWWKSFFVPFSAGAYLFIYSIQYYLDQLQFTRLSTIIYYFGTMYMASLCLGLICGTVGFISSYMFVRKIYQMIKLD